MAVSLPSLLDAATPRPRRWRALTAIIIVGTTLSSIVFFYERRLDEQHIQDFLEFRTEWRTKDLEAKLTAAIAPVEAAAKLIFIEDPVDPRQFHNFVVARPASDPTAILAWAPLVPLSDRAAFERVAASDGFGAFAIRQGRPDGIVEPAPDRPDYLPIWLEEHASVQTRSLRGLDILAEATRRAMIDQAIANAAPVASPPVAPLTDAKNPRRYLILWPIFQPGPVPVNPIERRRHLRGMVIGGVDFLSLLTLAIADTPSIPEQIVINVDGGPPEERTATLYDPSIDRFHFADPAVIEKLRRTARFVNERDFTLLGRQWTLSFYFQPAIVDTLRSSMPFILLLSGLLLTGLIALNADRERLLRWRAEESAVLRGAQLTSTTRELDHAAAERERAETALRHYARLIEMTLQASPLAIVHLGAEGDLLVWNRAAENLFGYVKGQLTADLAPLVGTAERPVMAMLLARLEQGESLRDEAIELHHRDGQTVPVSLSGEAIFADRAFQGSVLVLEDMSHRLALEAQLRQSQKMEAIGQLTGGMAHDFNNLLLVILGNIGMLSESLKAGSDDAALAAEVRDAALRGASLVRSLLAFARRQPLRPERTDVNQLIAGQVALLERTLGEQIEVSADLVENLWPVMVDSAQLETALLNLATNARDAMEHGGRLTIATRNSVLDRDYAESHPEVTVGDYVMIEVSDTGTGMPPEVIAQIFEPFFTTKPRGDGTGLGLSMVFGFMKQSGGHIGVYSELGVGTTFRLFVPRCRAAEADPASEDAGRLAVGQGEAILLVEDNAAIQRLALRQIRQLGYRCHAVGGAQAALDYIASGAPVDLLFSDVVMQGDIDGIKLAERVHDLWPEIKILLTSGFPRSMVNSAEPFVDQAKLLSKPYQLDELAQALRECLD